MSPKKRGNPRERLCPWCSEIIPKGAWACPECGADENTGWEGDEESFAESVALPEIDLDDQDYDAYLEKEFGAPYRSAQKTRVLWIRRFLFLGFIALVILWLVGAY